jgi:nucleolar protein 58
VIDSTCISGQAQPKNKGKISRVLAAKVSYINYACLHELTSTDVQTALSARVDAMGEAEVATIALESRVKVEARLRQLEGGKAPPVKGASSGPKAYSAEAARALAPPRYNDASDMTLAAQAEIGDQVCCYNARYSLRLTVIYSQDKKKKRKVKEEVSAEQPATGDGADKPKKKKKTSVALETEPTEVQADVQATESTSKTKKAIKGENDSQAEDPPKKRTVTAETDAQSAGEDPPKKKKKKKAPAADTDAQSAGEDPPKKKKKKAPADA